jgi:flagellar biosynthesis/type III secretory pathway protein FliH
MLSTEWDWEEALEVAREEGWEDGLEEGVEKGIEFTVYNALSKGIPVQTIQDITGLEMNAIEAIRAKL